MMKKSPMNKKFLFCRILLLVMALFSLLQASSAAAVDKIIGRVENILLEDAGIEMKGRIDTGAGVTSLHAEILEISKPKGKSKIERVKFRVSGEDGKSRVMEREIIDWANIKRKGADGFDKRPVVMLDICIAGKQVEARVNLADRSAFLYPALIGRNLLKAGDFLINPARTFMHKPTCK
jgi:hypothetical protein